MTVEDLIKEKIIQDYGTIADFCRIIGIGESTIRMGLRRTIGGMQAHNLYKISEALKIDLRELLATGTIQEQPVRGMSLTQKEWNFITQYRTLDSFGVEAVDSALNIENRRNRFYDNKINYIYRPQAPMSAAAGLGDLIDPYATDYESIKIPRTPEAEASDFVIRISGDYMEPLYPDRSLLLIRNQPAVGEDQAGLFVYQGDAFVKIWSPDGSLKSINSNYPPIKITDWERFQTIGKVCGITEQVE